MAGGVDRDGGINIIKTVICCGLSFPSLHACKKIDHMHALREIPDDTFEQSGWNPDISASFLTHSTKMSKILQCRQYLLITNTF